MLVEELLWERRWKDTRTSIHTGMYVEWPLDYLNYNWLRTGITCLLEITLKCNARLASTEREETRNETSLEKDLRTIDGLWNDVLLETTLFASRDDRQVHVCTYARMHVRVSIICVWVRACVYDVG